MSRALAMWLVATCACSERVLDVVVPADAAATFPRSCLEMYAPSAPDGLYWLDPDGTGPLPAAQYFCDMGNGGWTRIVRETFDAPSPAFSLAQPFMPMVPPPSGVPLSACGGFGSVLGGHSILGFRDEVTLALALSSLPHTQLRVAYDLVVLDSWDGEQAYLEVDGQEVWSQRCSWGNSDSCGQTVDECGFTGVGRVDAIVPVDVTVAHSAASVLLGFGAELDQGRGDESWGVDNLSVSIR